MGQSKNVKEVGDSTFEHEVLASPVPVLVDFGAKWCGPCKALDRVIDRIADDTVGRVKVAKVDVDDAPEVAAKYGVRGVPTVFVFAGGQKVAQHIGATSREKLLSLLPSQ